MNQDGDRGPTRTATARADAGQGRSEGARDAGVWSYEPKWDGFRALVFRDGDEIVLQSRNGKELGRYFPELLDALRDELAPRCVLDGEVVVPREIDGRIRLDWESLSQRIHPAESRVKMLAEQTPAHFIGFDALATGDKSLMERAVPGTPAGAAEPVNEKQWCHVTRTTEDPEQGVHWLTTFEGAGPGRRDRQAARRSVPAGQAGDGEGQARARRRLRGHRLPDPQERRGRRVDPARPLPR